MTVIEALILGAVQGLTEFLPVSSSGHLVLFQHLLGIQEPPLTFDIMVHVGTLVAVFIVFWPDITDILRKPLNRLTYLIIVGCIPAGLAGFFLQDLFEKAFSSILVVGLGLLFTGAILMAAERYSKAYTGLKEIHETTYMDAVWIGLMQALAIVPGISRSGSTISAGLFRGMDRVFAARFSFLLSIPVILGAAMLQLKDIAAVGINGITLMPMAVGFIAAVGFGYFAIKVVLQIINQGRLSVFSHYCWAIGAIALVANLFQR